MKPAFRTADTLPLIRPNGIFFRNRGDHLYRSGDRPAYYIANLMIKWANEPSLFWRSNRMSGKPPEITLL